MVIRLRPCMIMSTSPPPPCACTPAQVVKYVKSKSWLIRAYEHNNWTPITPKNTHLLPASLSTGPSPGPAEKAAALSIAGGERREEGHFTHRQSRRAEREGRGGGADVVGYAVRGRCGHRIEIIRRAGEDDDGDRDCVLGVRAYGPRGENRDYVPANQGRGEGVVHNRCSRPGIQTNNRVCVLGRGYHRRQTLALQ